MTTPKIEKGIPIPLKKNVQDSLSQVLRNMEPGDSLLIEKKQSPSFRAKASYLKIKITTREVSETHLRLWKL